jgi:HD-GYP domain-containing protein (c-di-GMP phosphodiesterase class II)
LSSNPSSPKAAPVALTGRSSIALSLLAALVFVALVPLTIISWRLIQLNKEDLATAHQEKQLLVAGSLARALDLQVEGLRSELLHVAGTLSVALAGEGDDEIQRVLRDVANPRLPALRLSRFHTRRVSAVEAGTMPEELKPHFDEILRQAIEVHAERRGESWSVTSKPLIVGEGRAVQVVAAPVVAQRALRGVLWGLVDLERVWEQALGRGAEAYLAFALDEEGSLFASTDRERLAPGTDVTGSPLVQRFLSQRDVATGTMPFTLVEDGREREYEGAFAVTGQDWGVFVQAPRDDVFVSIHRMRWQTVKLASIALGLAALVAMVFTRTLSNPIQQLAAASRAFARGDFSSRVAVRSSNEVGELARTFNHMAGEIESYIQRLRRALAENNELFLGTIRALAQAVDAKDPYTRGHSDRVTSYAVVLARQLELAREEIRDIHIAAQLHDVGKIGIDDAILQKPGALTDEEFAVMKTHTVKGAAIMSQIPQMERIIPGLRWHHERADGRGYPDGLTGEAIPLMARIIAVADTFDAITTRRPYQAPMGFERARARINELREVALDARVVDAFNGACDQGLIRLGSAEAPPAVVAETLTS